MNRTLIALALAGVLTATAFAATTNKATPKLGTFGVDLSSRDLSVKPGDDFNRYASGQWLDSYQLKDDETSFGSFRALRDDSEAQTRQIFDAIAKRTDLKPGSNEQKVRDYYNSYMNRDARNAAGIAPLKPVLDKIAAVTSMPALIKLFGESDVTGTNAPIGAGVSLDRMNPDRYLIGIGVGGFGLPDKDYYVNQDPRFVEIRAAYIKHMQTMLGFDGVTDGKARAEAVMALETELAKATWDRAELRNRDKTYNLTKFADLSKLYPGYDWNAQLKAQGLPIPAEVNVSTPNAVGPIIAIVNKTPLNVWRDYLTISAIDNNAGLLSKKIDDAAFAFNGTVLSGQKAQRDDWKRAIGLVGGGQGLGDAVGQIYVAKFFKPEAKAAMDQLVANLRVALRENLGKIDWMSDATKTEAYKKLDSFRPKIGYPSKWKDYSSVKITPDNLMANVLAMRKYYLDDQNARIGKKTDRDEWFMTPQTVNAYYNSSFNEIVFPAAILQPPFFDINADPAVNYGAIGAVIGHEMGHGFDDQGSKSDWEGIQRNWWTDEDRARFETRVKALGAQYDAYCPVEKVCVNGALTMGENIGDLGGLSMAYTAYHLSLKGKPAPVIDGLTGDQRFFMAFAQVWKGKYRDQALVAQIKSDPHSPAMFRANGPVRNFDPWYAAFNVKPGDKMYLPPDQRVRIW
ncbi:M13 family metallopeptidase [Thermomonas sp.]|uniref:M13 family metallopeptidase n=1 Tax=Thermomonas sp. TaxID=1971895 RepID=UPI0024887C5F|nr:M13 family metallopeptidase [Thermomonas sp.]MDI1252374.1 M13 family metallopeptidase [Thermomonas sp.]